MYCYVCTITLCIQQQSRKKYTFHQFFCVFSLFLFIINSENYTNGKQILCIYLLFVWFSIEYLCVPIFMWIVYCMAVFMYQLDRWYLHRNRQSTNANFNLWNGICYVLLEHLFLFTFSHSLFFRWLLFAFKHIGRM